MSRNQGRDQLAPMERLTQILSLLSSAERQTLSADRILDVVAYGAGTVEDRRDQLRRDIRHLETLGWEITNVAEEGEAARYRLVAVDNRLRVEFTPQQRAQLLRAAHAAGLAAVVGDLGSGTSPPASATDLQISARQEPASLALVQRAVASHCRLMFRYRDRSRTAHPQGLHVRPGGWYLTAVEDGDSLVKTYAVARMSEVQIDGPGTAAVVPMAPRPRLDPISWQVDPRTDVMVETTEEHRPHVESLLGVSSARREGAGGAVELTIPVTHRAAFRRRLYELGSRVRLVGPQDVRDEVRAELQAVVEGG